MGWEVWQVWQVWIEGLVEGEGQAPEAFSTGFSLRETPLGKQLTSSWRPGFENKEYGLAGTAFQLSRLLRLGRRKGLRPFLRVRGYTRLWGPGYSPQFLR